MGIFDRKTTRRRPANDGSGSNGFDIDLDEVRRDVPDVEDTVDDIERALREPMTKEERRGCACWG